MKIQKLIARHIRIPLRKPIKHASHERQETDNLLIECHLANGVVGYGEGVPRDYVTGETIATALAVLQKNDVTPLTTSPASFAEAIRCFESWNLVPVEVNDPRGISTHAVRCAVELGWLDAWGQHFQQPVSAVTSIMAPELYEPREQVQYSVAITSATGLKLVWQALTRRWFGFKQCKVKVGMSDQNDVARLRTIRKFMGKDIALRVDANEAWKVEDVARLWEQLSPFHIEWVEQPVLHEDIGKLAKIRDSIPMRVMLDESLCGMMDAQSCLQEKWGDLFNLRLSKCGGFIQTLRLAQFAQQHGLGMQLGCQVGETAVLSAAGRHFACSVKGLLALEGSYDRWLVKESLGKTDITFGPGGMARSLKGPGLGIQLDSQAIDRVTRQKVVILG